MGIITRAGLTPTDILHAEGRLDVWNSSAAKMAVELYASDMGVSHSELCSLVMDAVKNKLNREIIEGTLENGVKGPYVPGRFTSFAKTLADIKSDYISFNVSANQPIIGIGAPVRAYLPDVCVEFGTEPVIPPHAEVANAVGAVAGRIVLKTKATVSLSSDGDYLVHTQLDFKAFTEMEEAENYAVSQVRRILAKRVRDDYSGLRFRYDIKSDRQNADSMDGSVFIETSVVGMAVCVSISSKIQSID
jgi:hypothetical protein